MGTGEGGTPTKPTKTAAAAPEPVATPSYTEWAAALQAYYGAGATPPPPGYFPSSVASGPQPHPYMWGAQPLMAPYGTPPHHAALYPYGGIYAHPSMPPGALPYGQYGMPASSTDVATVAATTNTDTEAKSSEGKDRNAMKSSKGSFGNLGMITGKGSEAANGASESANGHTQSGESGSEASSEASEDDDTPENDLQKGRCDQQLISVDGQGTNLSTYAMQGGDGFVTQGGPAIGNPVNPAAVSGKVAAGPTTNLHIGMDYWNGSIAASPSNSKGKRISAAIVPASPNAQHLPGRDAVPTELWLQDEREIKRQRRKQSNRESARRSRLRKQAECEELSKRVDTLTVENMALRTELSRLAEECKKLASQNALLVEGAGEGGGGLSNGHDDVGEERRYGGGKRSSNNNNNKSSSSRGEELVEESRQSEGGAL